MVRSVFAVVESETSSVNELVHTPIEQRDTLFINELALILIGHRNTLFIQAFYTALVSTSIDGEHSLLINAILIEHLSPLLVILIVYPPITPWMGQLHIQQHPLHLWLQHSLQFHAPQYRCQRTRSTPITRTLTLNLLGQVHHNYGVSTLLHRGCLWLLHRG